MMFLYNGVSQLAQTHQLQHDESVYMSESFRSTHYCISIKFFIRFYVYKTYSHWSEFNLSNAAGYYSNFLILLTSCEDNTMHFHYFPIMTFYFKIFHQNNPGYGRYKKIIVCCYDIIGILLISIFII